MSGSSDRRIDEILVEAGLINSKRVEKLSRMQDKSEKEMEKILLSDEAINNKGMLAAEAKRLGVDFTDLEEVHVAKEAVVHLDAKVARRYYVFPFAIQNDHLCLAMKNPEDIFIIDEIKVFAGMEIKPFLADEKLIGRALDYFYPGIIDEKSEKSVLREAPLMNDGNAPIKPHSAVEISTIHEKDPAQDVDIIIDKLISRAIKSGVGHIYLNTCGNILSVRFKKNGAFLEEMRYITNSDRILQRLKDMACISGSTDSGRYTAGISYPFSEKTAQTVEFDLVDLPSVSGEALLLRARQKTGVIPLEEIGMTQAEQDFVKDMLDKKSGMIVISGSKGSGKTTTLYSLAANLLSRQQQIISVENEPSGRIEGITQIKVPGDHSLSMMQILERATAFEPDALIVDIPYDEAIARFLMKLSLQGVKVIASMPFKNTFEVFSGLSSVAGGEFLPAASLKGIISQELVRKLCPQCRNGSGVIGNRETADSINICGKCGGNGYIGKTAVFEVFRMLPEIRRKLMQRGSIERLESYVNDAESRFKNNCIRLVNDEVTSMEEIIRTDLVEDIYGHR